MTTIDSIYRKYYNTILNYINWKINNLDDAMELTNDVFLKFDRVGYNPERMGFENKVANVGSYLHTIANTLIIDYTRTYHQDKYIPASRFFNENNDMETFQFEDVNASAETNVAKDELQYSLNKAFSGLKPKYRKIAVLYFVKEKKYDEIAELCNVPLGTVKGMIARARVQLQGELDGMYHVRQRVAVE
jgi:RNA polymerase sigma-70 factor (ECF subfamily)